MVALFQGHTGLRNLYPRGGGEARFYGFLTCKDRLHREILNDLGPSAHDSTHAGLSSRFLFKTWQGEDEVEFSPLRMRRRFATCGCVLRISLWLKLHSQIEMATAGLWKSAFGYGNMLGSGLIIIDHDLNDLPNLKRLFGRRCGHTKGCLQINLHFLRMEPRG
jgi:hypothetical protein